MKRMLLILMGLPLILMTGCSGNEPETTKAPDAAKEAVISFSSFSGGGYEYTVEIDDPSIVGCESGYVFEETEEVIDGATYDFVATFTGLKPGTTTVKIFGRSPNLTNEVSIYQAVVYDDLDIYLSQVRAISRFYLYRNGDKDYDLYEITLEDDGYYVSVNEEEPYRIDDKAADELMKIIDKYDLVSWDDFSGRQIGVAHGETFWLEFDLTDGTGVLARGENTYPDNYFDAIEPIQKILDKLKK